MQLMRPTIRASIGPAIVRLVHLSVCSSFASRPSFLANVSIWPVRSRLLARAPAARRPVSSSPPRPLESPLRRLAVSRSLIATAPVPWRFAVRNPAGSRPAWREYAVLSYEVLCQLLFTAGNHVRSTLRRCARARTCLLGPQCVATSRLFPVRAICHTCLHIER